MQLLHQYSPLSAAMLAGLVLGLEPIGWNNAEAGTLLGVYSTAVLQLHRGNTSQTDIGPIVASVTNADCELAAA